MWKKTLLVVATLIFAFGVLFVSVFRTASVKYDFNPLNPEETMTVLGDSTSQVDYYLPYPGNVLPDSPLWPIKAVRDKLWLWTNTNPSREAELTLLFADKRLGGAETLFEKGKPEIGLSTLTKAEKYLEEADNLEQKNRKMGINTDEFLVKIAKAALKHYEVTSLILKIAPEAAKPMIVQSQVYSKNVYENARNTLLDNGIIPPENPFNW
jgi:hypothetical protein